MPIIFASTVLTFLNCFCWFYSQSRYFFKLKYCYKCSNHFYSMTNFVLILAFSLFYSNLILNPNELAKDLNKMVVTIPGIRPGNQTKEFLNKT